MTRLERAKSLLMLAISDVADSDEEQIIASLEALSKEFGLTDYFNAVVGVAEAQ